ncbi:MAG: transcriptional regulator [Microbacterium sp. 71-36]|uniref:winged helix-turn-helix domain-containing protein n=1 Tax=unclassified Microbacterium TaxID=2609290 RepID=UPI00086E2B76|nr:MULTISPECIES: helix-turn-helix domain-containing protein [unclassified Microbacterium]MBN9212801.1 helix-turn-helix transcriptional regulator [Microbacterium sp.]ODT39082.1 MAG: transcriptional regulator [Microbacterium sp. SCN 71-17]ODU51287.1 MAG: transcriptional regulator [Microbacterium sp. SCN 70-10]OJV77088.1 MAG: transcriptional regulator [Microbacterium sp. 71-36]
MGSDSRPEGRILDAGALRALAHPLRVRLYDLLSQYGPQTASGLAGLTGESTGATSYHLRALAQHDLIREVQGRGTARERWWERPAGAVTLVNPEMSTTPSGRAVMEAVHSETLTLRQQQLMTFVTHGWDDDQEWFDRSLISTASARLTVDQMAELADRLQSVIAETVDRYRDQSGDDLRVVTMRADVFPLPAEGGTR